MSSKEKKMDRRTFIKTTGVGSASLALSVGLSCKLRNAEAAQENPSDNKLMPTRIFGKTGFPVSILSLGGGVDWTINQSLLKMAFNIGINFWDSAHNYENGKSEVGIGQYFEKYPEDRKKIFLASKPDLGEVGKMNDQLNTSLERLKLDSLDLYLLHGANKTEILTPEVKAWVERLKKGGKIRFFGFSCHANMAQMLMHSAKIGWIDAIMPSYNFNIMNDDEIKKAVDACYQAGVGLVAMKSQGLTAYVEDPYLPLGPLKDEDLKVTESFMAKGYTPQQAKLKAIWTDERISSCVSQIKNLTILKSNVAAATDRIKLSESDMGMLNRLAQANRSLYCQGCMRCESAMPSECRIHDIMRYMMYYNSYGEKDEARRLFRALPASLRKGLASKDYSPAENACPRNIKIGKMMRKAVRILGSSFRENPRQVF
jgi:predicted aldo/keto reductase-like oxidoreductase